MILVAIKFLQKEKNLKNATAISYILRILLMILLLKLYAIKTTKKLFQACTIIFAITMLSTTEFLLAVDKKLKIVNDLKLLVRKENSLVLSNSQSKPHNSQANDPESYCWL